MADTKLSALTELAAAPASDDELYIRDVSEEPATESKRITAANIQDHTPKSHTLDSHATSRIGKDRMEWTADKLLKGAGAGSDPTEIDMPVPKSIATGSYVGNGADDRQITTGFKCSLVIIQTTEGFSGDETFILIPSMTIWHYPVTNYHGVSTTYLHATDGFAVSGNDGNDNTKTYYYWAISE